MSLVLAIKARDGIVLASDSQTTAGSDSFRTRAPARKLEDLHGKVAFGCAGSGGLRQRVVSALREGLTPSACDSPIADLRPLLHEIVNPLQQQALREHVELPATHPPCIELLFAGVTGGQKWIYEIAADGKDEEHNFAEAVGIARHYAIHGMLYHDHLELAERPIQQVRVAAYRIVMTTIHADATGAVGIPVQLYEVREGQVRLVPDEELKVMHDGLNMLKERERDLWLQPPEEAKLAEPVDGVRVD